MNPRVGDPGIRLANVLLYRAGMRRLVHQAVVLSILSLIIYSLLY